METETYDGAPEGVTEDTSAVLNTDETTSQIGDDAAAATDQPGEGDQAQPKRSSVQDRIDELTRDKHAERRAREALERELAQLRAQVPQPKAEAPKAEQEPDPASYHYGETDPGYIRDLARYEAKQAFQAEAQRQQQQAQAQAAQQTWQQRQDSFAKEHPDFYERVFADNLPISPPMAQAIQDSEAGPAVAYHLAQNPDEARRIAGLNPLAQIRELGKLEAKLSTPTAAPTPQPKTVSDAPAPHPQARGQGGKFKVAPDTTDFAAFERSYGNG